jgi:adenylate cyclase
VRYVLAGSLRRAGNAVRVNVQLIDAANGGEVWADRLEGDWTRSMALQDEITARLARTLDLEMTAAEGRRALSERPGNPDAIDLAMRAWSVLNRPLAREQLAEALELFEQAQGLDPELPEARVGLARTLAMRVNSRWSTDPAAELARGEAAVAPVLAAFPNHAMAHFAKGEILRASKRFEAAIAEYEAAIAGNRNLAPAYAAIGNAKIRAGRAEEAFAPLETAVRLSPRDPLLSLWYFQICHAHTHLAQDADAIDWCKRSIAVFPYWIAYVDLASAYAWTGRDAEARAAVADLRRLMPGYTVDRWRHEGWSDNPVFLEQYQRIIAGLQKAGLPER